MKLIRITQNNKVRLVSTNINNLILMLTGDNIVIEGLSPKGNWWKIAGTYAIPMLTLEDARQLIYIIKRYNCIIDAINNGRRLNDADILLTNAWEKD